mmetsp:Transcript_33050/g.93543  ORF Transcript_33050/g.93543 Transcript_33050/m.93543 type:complete len:237 (-) Transcript_33050:334-1044(-)
MQNGKLSPQLLVVAVGPAACTLLHYCASSKQVVGSIVMSENGMSGNTLRPSPGDSSCFVYSLGDEAEVLLVSCQYTVHPERAHAWVQGLLTHVDPARTVIMAAAPASEVQASVGARDAETPVFFLQTDAWREAAAEDLQPVSALPCGNVITGLPARLISSSQARGMKACLLVLRQPTPMPDARSLQILCQAASATLLPFSPALAVLGLSNRESVRLACAHAEQLQWGSGISGTVYM